MNPEQKKQLQDTNPYIGKSIVELTALRQPLEDALSAYYDTYPAVDDLFDEIVSKLNQIDYAANIAIATNNFGV